MNQENDKIFFNYADQFINIANTLFKAEPSKRVGAAFMYAAARFCAYEAFLTSRDFAADMGKNFEHFASQYENYLRINLEYYNVKLGNPQTFGY